MEPLITSSKHGLLGLISSMEYDSFGNNLYFCDEDALTIEVISLTTFSRTVIAEGTLWERPVSLTLSPEHGLVLDKYVAR